MQSAYVVNLSQHQRGQLLSGGLQLTCRGVLVQKLTGCCQAHVSPMHEPQSFQRLRLLTVSLPSSSNEGGEKGFGAGLFAVV